MSRFRLRHFTSLEELRDAAPAWDDLWWRSEATRPTARAELVAQWVEQFAPQARFHALAVEADGQLVAALPLVQVRRCRLLPSGGLPANFWSPGGDLLLDLAADTEPALDLLVAAMRGLPWPLLWFDEVPFDSVRWTALFQSADRAAVARDVRPLWQVPWIVVDHDWESCKQRWSKKHLTKMVKAARHLAEQGDAQFRTYAQLDAEQVERWLLRAFEIEDRSWKGDAGSSVLRTPGMFQFFTRQAEQLARWEQLELSFLELDGRPIAFVYGFGAKGVSHWHKIGYDPKYRCSSPGQLLQYHLLEQLHREPERMAVDCIGPLTDALSKWMPSAYPVGRVILAPRLLGRCLLHACKHWWPRVARLLGKRRPGDVSGEPGPALPVGVGEQQLSHSSRSV